MAYLFRVCMTLACAIGVICSLGAFKEGLETHDTTMMAVGCLLFIVSLGTLRFEYRQPLLLWFVCLSVQLI